MKKKIDEIDLLLELAKEREKYFKDYLFYAKKIKKIAKEKLKKVEVFLFDSILERNEISRDIDLLIISPELKNKKRKRK